MSDKLHALYDWIETKHGDPPASKLSQDEKAQIAEILAPKDESVQSAEELADKVISEYINAKRSNPGAAYSGGILSKAGKAIEADRAAQRQAGREEAKAELAVEKKRMFLRWLAGRGPCSGEYCEMCPDKDEKHPIALPSKKAIEALADLGKERKP
jgi:hypothetical protein